MVEAQHVRVEREPAERIRSTAVRDVAGDRVPEPREVDADLVPAPGLEPHLEQGVARGRAEQTPVRDRRAAAPWVARLTHLAGRIVEEPARDGARGPCEP